MLRILGDAAHLLHLIHALQIIIKSKLCFLRASAPSLSLSSHQSSACAFSIRDKHITHAEDSGSHTIRIKLFQIRKLLAHTYVKNRFSGHVALIESAAPPLVSPSSFVRMTPSIPIFSWKHGCHIDRILSGHGINYQHCLITLQLLP